MKKLFFSALMLGLGTMFGFAQLLNVASIEKVPSTQSYDIAEISPDGTTVVASLNGDRALVQVDLSNGRHKQLVADGSITGLKFTGDSKQVVYTHRIQNANKLSYKEVRAVDLTTGADRQIAQPMRSLNGVATIGNDIMVVADQKVANKGMLKTRAAQSTPVASIHYGQLMITNGGNTVALNPNGKTGQSYLWPSVSPDGKKVVYYLANSGCYVCNIDGSNVTFLGNLRAARWMGNDMVVGMRDSDDGERVLSSSIIAKDLKGNEQVLVPAQYKAMYPAISAKGDKIAFTTDGGDLYIININR